MMFSSKFTRGDEELGKKDDDLDLRRRHSGLLSRRPSLRRRSLVVVIIICILYFVFRPTPNASPPPEIVIPAYPGPSTTRHTDSLDDSPAPDTPPPRMAGVPDDDHGFYFNGPIKFYHLAKSLYIPMHLKTENADVMFATADPQAIGDFLPLACDMTSHTSNRVHLAVMGRNDLPLETIQRVNGYDRSECSSLIWHDARPDFGRWSTDSRMQRSVKYGLMHLSRVFDIQAVISYDGEREEDFLVSRVADFTNAMKIPHISLSGRSLDFIWLARLDAHALNAWNIRMEILIQVPPKSSGNVIRLLDSLSAAEYFCSPPGLTIELPHDVDQTLLNYLENFSWPPDKNSQFFTLRRRIGTHIDVEEASVRFADAVFPKDPLYSHVLVLSPQVTLAPSYFHFLKYAILNYKYATRRPAAIDHLVGISLELPSLWPTTGGEFRQTEKYILERASESQKSEVPMFMWQVPNSNAALYFGDKWREFQSFMANRRTVSSLSQKPLLPDFVMPKTFPAWVDYLFELMHARGYSMLFPAFSNVADFALSTIHEELYHQPEEFTSENKLEGDMPTSGNITLGSADQLLDGSSTISPLLEMFPGKLPSLSEMLVIPHIPQDDNAGNLVEKAKSYVNHFRTKFGGCKENEDYETPLPMETDDLFCLNRKEEL